MFEFLVEHYEPILQILLYTLIMAIIYSYFLFGTIQEHVKANWTQYRTQPVWMLIGGLFVDPPEQMTTSEYMRQNFVNLIWVNVSKFLEILMTPIYPILQMFLGMMKGITSALNKIRSQMAVMRQFLMRIFEQMYIRLQNSVAAVTFYFLKLREGLKRSYGLLNMMMSTMEHSYVFMQSLVRSPLAAFGNAAEGLGMAASILALGPGGIPAWRNALCFHPDTLIELDDGAFLPMMMINVGDVLCQRNKVTAKIVAKVSTPMYRLGSTLVSSDHRVKYGDHHWIRVKNHPLATPVSYPDEGIVVCLMTENGEIRISDQVFKDYVDEYSISKYHSIRHLTEYDLNGHTQYQSSSQKCADFIPAMDPSTDIDSTCTKIRGYVCVQSGTVDAYRLPSGVLLSGNVLVCVDGLWVRVCDVSGSVSIGKNPIEWIHYITESSDIQLSNGLRIRDFCETQNIELSAICDDIIDYS